MKKKGFSLIELLIVVAIIGILSTVVLVSLGPARLKSRDSRRFSDMRQISVAMEMCRGDLSCGGVADSYPLIADGTTPPNISPALVSVPRDPVDVSPYQYTWIANNLASPAGAPAQKYFCAYVRLEAPSSETYFCISSKGNKERAYAGPPTNADCCGFSL